jgi:hypothetical protein
MKVAQLKMFLIWSRTAEHVPSVVQRFFLRGSVSCGLMHVSFVVSCIEVPSLLQWPGSEVDVILFLPKGPQIPVSITSARNWD